MEIRCKTCLAATWIDLVEPLRPADSIQCAHCGTAHEVNPVPALGGSLGSQYRHTVEFANEMQIDMPSAYSVLLQVMTLNEVREAHARAKPAGDPKSARSSTRDGCTHEKPERKPRSEPEPPGKLKAESRESPNEERAVSLDAPTTAALFPELTDEELGLLERLAGDDAPETSGGSSPDESQEVLFPDLSPEELDLLERLAGDDTSGACGGSPSAESQEALFPDLSPEELSLLDGMEAADLEGTSSGADPGAARPRSTAPRYMLLQEVDPGFAKAVAKGLLDPQEAIRRGCRDTYAEEIAERHYLPMRLAYAVADNRVTLRKATLFRDAARKLRQPAPPPPPRGRIRWWSATLVIGAAASLVAMATWGTWNRQFEPLQLEIRRAGSRTPPERSGTGSESGPAIGEPTRDQILRSLTEVLTDETGRITRVSGPDPANVLKAYCARAAEADFFEPREVTDTVPRSRSARLGVFRDLKSLTANQAIRIRRDRQTRRWIAGDGLHPIQVLDQPNLPPGAFRMSIAAR